MNPSVKINYYDTFKCTADKCSLTCCQEWRIAVDEDTEKKWVGHQIKDDATNKALSLCGCLKKEDTGSIIELNEEKKCPFLNQDKLCKLVIGLGEDFLSKTCQTFPRQVKDFKDRQECSLTLCCPVVVDLISEQEPEMLQETLVWSSQEEAVLYEVREMMLRIMKNDAYTLTERMLMIFYSLLELLEVERLTIEKVKAVGSEKQLKPLIKAIRQMDFSIIDSILESNELFLDVVENYRKQGLYIEYLEPIAQIAEGIEEHYEDKQLLEKQAEFIKNLEAHEKLLKHYLIAEILGSSLLPESSLEDMVVAFEWLVLEYSVIRQVLFLKWLELEGSLPYEVIRDYLSVLSRVTGYDADDVYEFLEMSFEDIIWDWGYMAMVLGNLKI
ncbi:MAG: flagellin lysine-N-methylase [Cellulosilyticum sp.]|nr:flagellin lysine-N-methylase [Cellulosilyticum sp.]